MIENYTDLFSGHIQIHPKGFQKKMSLELSISNKDEIEPLLKNNPQILFYSERIKNYSLISSAENSSGILLMGIDPEKEKNITKLNKRIRRGKFLSKEKNDEIVIGKDLAEILNTDLGKKVVIMTQGADGSMTASAYRICGILDTGAEEIDKSLALINLSSTQELLVLDNKISEFVIRTNSVFAIDKITNELKNKVDSKKFEVLSWKEISPITQQWLEFDRAFSNVILLIVLIVVSAGILNTMLMAVLERIREFGIMLALGTRRKKVVFTVGLESFFLGLIGVSFGSILGLGLTNYFSEKGIDLSKFSQAFEAYYTGSIIYPRAFKGYVFLWSLIVLLVCVVTSIYPAYKAANLKPADALRY